MDRRTRSFKDLASMTPTTQDLLSEEIDGELFLYKSSPHCKICTTSDELKNIIDSLLLFPKSYQEVVEAIQPLQEKLGMTGKELINYDNIRQHQKRHLPFEKLLVREVVERRAREKNRSILAAGERLLTAEAFYEVIVNKGFEELVKGYATPNLNQTMHAMDMLHKLELEGKEDYKPEDLINQLDMILRAIHETIPEEFKVHLFDKLTEYQNGSTPMPGKPKKLKPAAIDVDDDFEGFVDEDEMD